jgi:hypothetical protein
MLIGAHSNEGDAEGGARPGTAGGTGQPAEGAQGAPVASVHRIIGPRNAYTPSLKKLLP